MRAGKMDRRIVIQQVSRSNNSSGAPVDSFSTWNTVWAEKIDERGEEFQGATRENAQTITKWRIRYISGLKSEMRISYNSQFYDIISIAELGRRDGWEIMTKLRIQ